MEGLLTHNFTCGMVNTALALTHLEQICSYWLVCHTVLRWPYFSVLILEKACFPITHKKGDLGY